MKSPNGFDDHRIEFTSDQVSTFGSFGVAEIPKLQYLLQVICNNGFEHHTSATLSQVADAAYEAMDKYLGWNVYYHK